MFKPTRIVVCIALLAAVSITACAQPSPPITGEKTVQMFVGGTQNVMVSVYPPSTMASGAPIKKGTPVALRFYRSNDGGLTYPTRVQIVSGGGGRVGQGVRGSKTPSWITARLKVPVDNKPPHLVHLAVTAVVDGVESAKVNSNLSFRYFPALRRYGSPAAANAGNGAPTPRGLQGKWKIDSGGTMTVHHQGKRFTATMTGPYEGKTLTITMTGTVQNTINGVVYEFTKETRLGSQAIKGDGRMTVKGNDVTGHMTMRVNGKSHRQKIAFRKKGTTLVDLTR